MLSLTLFSVVANFEAPVKYTKYSSYFLFTITVLTSTSCLPLLVLTTVKGVYVVPRTVRPLLLSALKQTTKIYQPQKHSRIKNVESLFWWWLWCAATLRAARQQRACFVCSDALTTTTSVVTPPPMAAPWLVSDALLTYPVLPLIHSHPYECYRAYFSHDTPHHGVHT